MVLLTQEILKRIPSIDEDRAVEPDSEKRMAHAKLFTPDANWTWYLIAYDPEEELAYGLVKGFEVEFGYISMAEIKNLRGPMGLAVERDRSFTKMNVKELYDKIKAGKHV
jgi:hypothetical protein